MMLHKVSLCRQGSAIANFLGEYCPKSFIVMTLLLKFKTWRFFSGKTARKALSRSRVKSLGTRDVRDVGKPGCIAAPSMEPLMVICFKVPVHIVGVICKCRCKLCH